MKLANSEKLILLMLSEIYDKLELNEIDTKLLRSAIYSQNTWALDWEMPGVVGSNPESTPKEVIDVVNYLDMWSMLEESYTATSYGDAHPGQSGSSSLGRSVRFPGFDGNNESEALSIARILVEDMDRFTRFKGRDLNSHAPLLPAYARMYKVYEPMRMSLKNRHLSIDQLVQVVRAMSAESGPS